VPLYNGDVEAAGDPPGVASFKAAIRAADAVLFVTPEYNHGVPGVMKNAVDWASRPARDAALNGKPVGIIGASPGQTGTARGQSQLRQAFEFTNSFCMPQPEILAFRALEKIRRQRRTHRRKDDRISRQVSRSAAQLDPPLQMSFEGAEHITASLEIATERAGDLTADIYKRLFADFPEIAPLFIMDRDGAVRGSMLSHAFNTILDFIGERRYAHNFIASEIVTHIAYDVPPDAFASFFIVMRDELRAACGLQWSPEMEDAWQRLLHDLERYVARPTHVA